MSNASGEENGLSGRRTKWTNSCIFWKVKPWNLVGTTNGYGEIRKTVSILSNLHMKSFLVLPQVLLMLCLVSCGGLLIPLSTQCYAWRALQDRITTKQNLLRRSVHVVILCVFYVVARRKQSPTCWYLVQLWMLFGIYVTIGLGSAL